MKTKISFSINSEEITKQINAVVTAEAKAAARKVASKQFERALDEKFATILKMVDEDIAPNAYRQSELRRLVISAINDAVKRVALDNAEIINKLVEKNVISYCSEIATLYKDSERRLDSKVKNAVALQVKEYMANAFLQAAFSKK